MQDGLALALREWHVGAGVVLADLRVVKEGDPAVVLTTPSPEATC